jgi:hypothetical protein
MMYRLELLLKVFIMSKPVLLLVNVFVQVPEQSGREDSDDCWPTKYPIQTLTFTKKE